MGRDDGKSFRPHMPPTIQHIITGTSTRRPSPMRRPSNWLSHAKSCTGSVTQAPPRAPPRRPSHRVPRSHSLTGKLAHTPPLLLMSWLPRPPSPVFVIRAASLATRPPQARRRTPRHRCAVTVQWTDSRRQPSYHLSHARSGTGPTGWAPTQRKSRVSPTRTGAPPCDPHLTWTYRTRDLVDMLPLLRLST